MALNNQAQQCKLTHSEHFKHTQLQGPSRQEKKIQLKGHFQKQSLIISGDVLKVLIFPILYHSPPNPKIWETQNNSLFKNKTKQKSRYSY
jgi:hypothetical protein